MGATELISALERTCALLDRSEESVWSPLSPAEVAANLRREIVKLSQGGAASRHVVGVEFAPTSTLQEIAMANGWQQEYMRLADIVDAYFAAQP